MRKEFDTSAKKRKSRHKLSQPRRQPEVGPQKRTQVLAPWPLVPIVAVLAGVAAYRFWVLADNPAPPGADPGNWLAVTYGLFGDSVRAAEATYFPVTLVCLRALLVVLSPLVALKVLGVGASVLMGIPFYLILRRGCSPLFSAGLTLAFLIAGYESEALCWGGYPQLLATTFLLLTVYWLTDGLISGERRPLLLAAVATALVAGTHHFTLLILAPTLLILGLALLAQERPDMRRFLQNARVWGLATALFSLPFLPWYIRFLTLLTGNPTNPHGFSVTDMDAVTAYVFEENRAFWIGLLIIATIVAFALPLLPRFRERAARIRPAALAVLAGSSLGFYLTSEIRTFQLIEAGAVLSLGVVVAAVEQHLAETEVRLSLKHVERLSLGLAMAAFLTIMVASGNERLGLSRPRYQILNASAVEALDWLRDETPPGTVVLANDSPTRVSYAWWVEGYARRPTYSLIEPDYLSFGQEKAQSMLATRLVDPETPRSEVQAILEETGIEYVFLDKRSGGRLESLLSKTTFALSLENEDYAVVHLLQAQAQRKP